MSVDVARGRANTQGLLRRSLWDPQAEAGLSIIRSAWLTCVCRAGQAEAWLSIITVPLACDLRRQAEAGLSINEEQEQLACVHRAGPDAAEPDQGQAAVLLLLPNGVELLLGPASAGAQRRGDRGAEASGPRRRHALRASRHARQAEIHGAQGERAPRVAKEPVVEQNQVAAAA